MAWIGVAWSCMAWRGFAWFRIVSALVWQHAQRDGREGDARLGRLAEAPARLIVHAVSAEVPAWVTVSTRVPAWATVPRESALSFGLAAAACSPSRIWLDYAPASPSRLEHFEHRPPLAVLDRVHCPLLRYTSPGARSSSVTDELPPLPMLAAFEYASNLGATALGVQPHAPSVLRPARRRGTRA